MRRISELALARRHALLLQDVAGEHGPAPRELGMVHHHAEQVEVAPADAVLRRGVGLLALQLCSGRASLCAACVRSSVLSPVARCVQDALPGRRGKGPRRARFRKARHWRRQRVFRPPIPRFRRIVLVRVTVDNYDLAMPTPNPGTSMNVVTLQTCRQDLSPRRGRVSRRWSTSTWRSARTASPSSPGPRAAARPRCST